MRFRNATYRHVRQAGIGTAGCVMCVLLSGARHDPEFMRYDADARRVELTITAAFDRSNSGFNFNGGSHGAHRITVPIGWKVQVTFVNRDVIEHSVAVVREQKLLPLRIARPVFAGAASRAPARGLPAGARQDDIAFIAGQSGVYLLACGVPGHAASGSYLRLTVSPDATVPTYEITRVAGR